MNGWMFFCLIGRIRGLVIAHTHLWSSLIALALIFGVICMVAFFDRDSK